MVNKTIISILTVFLLVATISFAAADTNFFTDAQMNKNDIKNATEIVGRNIIAHGNGSNAEETPTVKAYLESADGLGYAALGAVNSMTQNVGFGLISYGINYVGQAFGVDKANLSRFYSYGGPLAIGTWQEYNLTLGTNDTRALVIDVDQNIHIDNNLSATRLDADSIELYYGAPIVVYGNDYLEVSATGGGPALGANTGGSQTDSVFMGDYAGAGVAKVNSVAIGESALQSATVGSGTAVGYFAGFQNTGATSTFLGYYAGYDQDGDTVTFVGNAAGQANSVDRVTAIGHSAGQSNSGERGTFVGYNAGKDNTGTYSTGMGAFALNQNDGDYVTSLGYAAGYDATGHNGVYLGYKAGYQNTVDDQLIIRSELANAVALITGNFSSGNVEINENLTATYFNSDGYNVGEGGLIQVGDGVADPTTAKIVFGDWYLGDPMISIWEKTSDALAINTSGYLSLLLDAAYYHYYLGDIDGQGYGHYMFLDDENGMTTFNHNVTVDYLFGDANAQNIYIGDWKLWTSSGNLQIISPLGATLLDFDEVSDTSSMINFIVSPKYNGATGFISKALSGQTVDSFQIQNESGDAVVALNATGKFVYEDSEVLNIATADVNYEAASAHFDASTTVNITCLDAACDWYTNATDSCMYWPSGGKDCGA